MVAIARIRLRLNALRQDQRGIALPTAMMALIVSFALASVAVVSTVDVQQGSRRDHDSKEAIAAADAGANVGLLRLNRFLPKLSAEKPCVGPDGTYQTPSGGWCPSTPTESVGDGSYSYMVSAYSPNSELHVVSVGSAGNVSRRVEVSLQAMDGPNVFADESLIGEKEIYIEGSSVVIETNLGTNGNIDNNASPKICGDARHGVGKSGPTPSCEGEKTEGEKVLPPVVPPENIATENSNCRLARTCANGEVDTITKNERETTKGVSWTEKTATGGGILSIGSGSALTMGGRDYWVCGLFLNSGTIYMPVEAEVQIFIDTPEHCGLAPGAVQVEVKGNSNIQSTGLNPQQSLFEVPRIYLVGDGAVNLEGNVGSNEVIIYGPQSAIDLGGNATWNGLIAGSSLTLHGNVKVISDSRIKKPEQNLASLFQRTRYVECTGASASPPDASC